MNTAVLVLNHNYEPLNVCNTRRAMGLLIGGKAEMVQNGRGTIRTPSTEFLRPSVIRMQYMVRRPQCRPRLSRREVFRRDDYTCQYCGQRGWNLTLDHVIPRHRGGMHSWDNLVTACRVCNRRKGGRTPQEAGMMLLRLPREPHESPYCVFASMLDQYEEWSEFILGWV
jgi:5-methylcytosine-specific restriction endonuclease McrA